MPLALALACSFTFALLHRPKADLHLCTVTRRPCPPVNLSTGQLVVLLANRPTDQPCTGPSLGPWVGTALRAVRSPKDVRNPAAGSESQPYPMPAASYPVSDLPLGDESIWSSGPRAIVSSRKLPLPPCHQPSSPRALRPSAHPGPSVAGMSPPNAPPSVVIFYLCLGNRLRAPCARGAEMSV